jgi:hypothetical protein
VVWAGPRAGYLGVADGPSRTITIYVRPGATATGLAYDLAHEFGHVLDFDRLSNGGRQQWAARRGLNAAQWYGCNMCTDYSTPAGDWAESVAVCLTGNTGRFRSALGGSPSAADCGFISDAVGGW